MTPTLKTLQLALGRRRLLTRITHKLQHHLALTVLALKDITVDAVIRTEGVDLIPILAGLAVLRRVPAVSFPVLLVAEKDALVAGPAFAEIEVGAGAGACAFEGGWGNSGGVGDGVGVEVFESDDFFGGGGRVLCHHGGDGEGEEEGEDDGWGGDVHDDLLACLWSYLWERFRLTWMRMGFWSRDSVGGHHENFISILVTSRQFSKR